MDSCPVSLLERLKQPGNSAAWERFVRLYSPLLYHWLRGAGLQEADAADLVQDILTVLVTRLPEFAYDRKKNFHGWLRTLTMNRWRDFQKRKALVRIVAGDSVGPEAAGPDPLEAFIEREFHGRLALEALRIMKSDFSGVTYQAFWDFVIRDEPAAKVAKKHGLSVGAVYAAKFRVLSRLRCELQGLWVGNG